jgi:hypothetical protein
METGLQAFLLLALHRGEWLHNLAVSPFERKLDLVPGRSVGAGEKRKISISAGNPTVFRVIRSLYLLGYPNSPTLLFFIVLLHFYFIFCFSFCRLLSCFHFCLLFFLPPTPRWSMKVVLCS